MNKKQLVRLLYKHFYDEQRNCIDLSYLDFSEYNCDVLFSSNKVNGTLCQTHQMVTKNLWQGSQFVKGDLYQSNNYVGNNLFNGFDHVVNKKKTEADYEMDPQEIINIIKLQGESHGK